SIPHSGSARLPAKPWGCALALLSGRPACIGVWLRCSLGRTLGNALLLRRGWGPGRGQPLAVDRSPAQRVGFSGTVVADYFGIAFLEKLHRIAERAGRRPCSPSVPVWTLNCPASKRMEPHSS